MFGSVISRLRVLMLLLAFALGLAGQLVSGAAMAAQMQAAANAGMATEMDCPGCPSDQAGGMAVSCNAACWTIPALPAQSGTAEFTSATVFIPSVDLVIAGIVTRPDPHPPRSFLHT
jgi:hypothetical protein